jgi:DNA mismatch endonuclease, patch repair protein
MRWTRRSGTRPELALRSALHRRGLRFVVDRSVPGGNRRRRVDILLRGARIAVFVDGCFWHSCPEHSHLPKTNTSWWRLKFRGIARRDCDTDAQLAAAGWLAVRIWEHEDPIKAARMLEQLVRDRAEPKNKRAPASSMSPWRTGTCTLVNASKSNVRSCAGSA